MANDDKDVESNSFPVLAGVPDPSFRYRTLDAWRGLACILVVIYHSTMHVAHVAVPGGSWCNRLGYSLLTATSKFAVGVPIFFVISGYCIMATLDSRRRKGEGVAAFFWRRFRRIYPPYWVALVVSAIAIGLCERFFWPGLFTHAAFRMAAPDEVTASQWLGNLTLTESWRYHLAGGNARYLMGHVWTLCFEEQFYAVAALLLVLMPRRIFLAALVVTLSIPVVRWLANRNAVNLDGTILGGEWFLFAAGIAVYYRIHYAGRFGRWINTVLFTVAILVPALDPGLFTRDDRNGSFTPFVAFLFAFLLAALYPNDAEMASWRILRPFSFCGRICYSLYLIHPLVTTGIGHAFYEWGLRGNWQTLLVTLPVSFALSLPVSIAFYFLVERQFLNSSRGSP